MHVLQPHRTAHDEGSVAVRRDHDRLGRLLHEYLLSEPPASKRIYIEGAKKGSQTLTRVDVADR